jgi:hypothetical protein
MKTAIKTPVRGGKAAADDQFCMSKDHQKKCLHSVFESFDAINSIRASAKLFPAQNATDVGDVDVYVAVESFTDYIEKRLNVVLSILENEYKETTDTENT